MLRRTEFSTVHDAAVQGIVAVRAQATRARGVLALLIIAAPVLGCSMLSKDEDAVPEGPADKLYNEGLFLLNNKQEYNEAAKKFDK